MILSFFFLQIKQTHSNTPSSLILFNPSNHFWWSSQQSEFIHSLPFLIDFTSKLAKVPPSSLSILDHPLCAKKCENSIQSVGLWAKIASTFLVPFPSPPPNCIIIIQSISHSQLCFGPICHLPFPSPRVLNWLPLRRGWKAPINLGEIRAPRGENVEGIGV